MIIIISLFTSGSSADFVLYGETSVDLHSGGSVLFHLCVKKDYYY